MPSPTSERLVALEGSIPSQRCRHHGPRLSGRSRCRWSATSGRKRPPDCSSGARPRAVSSPEEVSPWTFPPGSGGPPIIVTVSVLLFDVIIIGRRPHEPSTKEVSIALVVYVGLAVAVRHRRLGPRRPPVRHRVLRRLADGVLAVGRQPVHLHHHHGQVRGAAAVPAGGPDGGHRAGAGDARRSSSPSAPRRSTSSAGSSTSSGCSSSARRSSSPRRATTTTTSTRRTGSSSGSRRTSPRPTSGTASRSSPRRTASGWSRRCSS